MAQQKTVTVNEVDNALQGYVDRMEFILALMGIEHEHASTHAQRNNYQATIRHEIETLKDEMQSRSWRYKLTDETASDIPF